MKTELCHFTDSMLPDEDICDLAYFFKVFGDSLRLEALRALHRSELCVTYFAEGMGMNASAVSRQLRILRPGKLVTARRRADAPFAAQPLLRGVCLRC